MDVKGDFHPLYTHPDAKSPLVANEKATAVTHKPETNTIDSSEQVQIQCEQGEWFKIQVVKPDWLTSVSGWVKGKYLAAPRKPGEFRTFTAEDIYWDEDTKKQKDMIVKAINRIHREDPRCKDEIDSGSIAKSSTQGTPSKPKYFLTCGSGMTSVNVFFGAEDVAAAKPFTAPGHIDHGTAVKLCEDYAKTNATHPSTVDFSKIMDLGISDHANGRTSVQSTFTAKNSYNLELKFNIHCLLDENGLMEANVSEASQ